MTVKIIIKRIVPFEKEKALIPFLKELRNLGINQPGYISGETLVNLDNRNEVVVISTWQSKEDWNGWVQTNQRKHIQDQIDLLLGVKTEYGIYGYA